jgi:hypothetical protein
VKCANPACRVQALDLRDGGIYAVDFPGGAAEGEGQIILRRVVWLCDICGGQCTVETWRPPGQQVRPLRRPREIGRPAPEALN